MDPISLATKFTKLYSSTLRYKSQVCLRRISLRIILRSKRWILCCCPKIVHANLRDLRLRRWLQANFFRTSRHKRSY